MTLLERYQQVKDAAGPSIIDRFDAIVAHLSTLVAQNAGIAASLDTIAGQLARPVRISTWGSSAITLVNTSEHKVPNPREVVAFSAWVEGSPLAAPGISLLFDDTLLTPTFQQVISGPLPNPTKVALTTVPPEPVHLVFLTCAVGGWQVW